MLSKQRFEEENLINQSGGKCLICDFLLLVGITFGPNSERLSYFDSIIENEHKFPRNIYETEVSAQPENLKTLKNVYKAFKFFVRAAFLLHDLYDGNSNIEWIDHELVEVFCGEQCSDLESFYKCLKKFTKLKYKS